MTYTATELLNKHGDLRCGTVTVTRSVVEKNGSYRAFLMFSFQDVNGDPAYAAISEPPKRGPVYARTANENGLLDMIKPIKVLNGGMMPKGTECEGFSHDTALENSLRIQLLGNFTKAHATIVALLLVDQISVKTAQELMTSFTNFDSIKLVEEDGEYVVADRSQLVTRKPRKKQAKTEAPTGNELEAEFAAHTQAIMDDVDDDELLLMGMGG